MSEFSEVGQTDKGRRYFALYDERFGNRAYIAQSSIRILEKVDRVFIELFDDFSDYDLRMAKPYKNGHINYIRDIGQEYNPFMFGVLEFTLNENVDPLEFAKKAAELGDKYE